MTTLPPRLSNEGSPYYGSDTGVGVVVVNTPRANVSVGEGGVHVRVGPRRRHNDNDHDDHDNDDHDNDHDENEEDDEDERGPLRSPGEQQAYNQRQWDKFSEDRPGSSLGCMVAHDGEYCAAKAVSQSILFV
jgi:hypothetical protein